MYKVCYLGEGIISSYSFFCSFIFLPSSRTSAMLMLSLLISVPQVSETVRFCLILCFSLFFALGHFCLHVPRLFLIIYLQSASESMKYIFQLLFFSSLEFPFHCWDSLSVYSIRPHFTFNSLKMLSFNTSNIFIIAILKSLPNSTSEPTQSELILITYFFAILIILGWNLDFVDYILK